MMRTISEINTDYIEFVEKHDIILHYIKLMDVAKEEMDEPKTLFIKYFQILHKVKKTNIYILSQQYTRDIIDLAECYNACINANNDLYKKLLSHSVGKITDLNEIKDLQTNIIEKQEMFSSRRSDFIQKYSITLKSLDSMNNLLSNCLLHEKEYYSTMMEVCRKEAQSILDSEISIYLEGKRRVPLQKGLPKQILIAQFLSEQEPCQLLKDLGIKEVYEKIFLDVEKQGNIFFEADAIDSDKLDEFVIAYICRYMEMFPAGKVHVHIFDSNPAYCYSQFCKRINGNGAGETTKKLVSIHSKGNEIGEVRSSCELILNKLVNIDGEANLFSLYENDQSNYFNLVIFRKGIFSEIGNYTANEFVNRVLAMIRPGDTYHKCGVRFLIIEDSYVFKQQNEHAVRLLKLIKERCSIRLKMIQNSFFIEEGEKKQDVNVLSIHEELNSFITDRTRLIKEELEKTEITLKISDIWYKQSSNSVDWIMKIPVGKAGEDIVELPFSCKDVKNTPEEKVHGYMVVGATGRGKSTLLHDIVLNGSKKYSPKDLEFWLLDFKNGVATSKYIKSCLPHITYIAEKNKVEEANCLFDMIKDEIERRSNMFTESRTNDISEHNKAALKTREYEYLPRIIILIDEFQELFEKNQNREYKTELESKIRTITRQMRAYGIHCVFISHDVPAFMDGKILRNMGGIIVFETSIGTFPTELRSKLINIKNEIENLNKGEAFVRYSDYICKMKIPEIISEKDDVSKCTLEIQGLYPKEIEKVTKIVGSTKPLSINSKYGDGSHTYYDTLHKPVTKRKNYLVIVGEDSYSMNPKSFEFRPDKKSSLLMFGNNRILASSLCASVTLSLMQEPNSILHLFNGDQEEVEYSKDIFGEHPFMYICNHIEGKENVKKHILNNFSTVLEEVFKEYSKRKDEKGRADCTVTFIPCFIIVNDLFAISDVQNNSMIREHSNDELGDTKLKRSNSQGKPITQVLNLLIHDGYNYGIYFVLTVKDKDYSNNRTNAITWSTAQMIYFNHSEISLIKESSRNSVQISVMLNNISSVKGDNSLAVCCENDRVGKFRPIIYNLSNKDEKDLIDKLLSK